MSVKFVHVQECWPKSHPVSPVCIYY